MEEKLIQLLAALVGTVGFSFLFNVEKRNIAVVSFGGLLVWGVYLVGVDLLHMHFFAATVLAAAICQIYAEIFARICKTPTTVLFIPAIVPLIPGGALYNTMYAAVVRDWVQFRSYGVSTLLGTLGIAVGLSFVSGVLYVFANLSKRKAEK